MCCICHEGMENKRDLMQLGCKHKFHLNCLIPMTRYSCPLCRCNFQDDMDAKLQEIVRDLPRLNDFTIDGVHSFIQKLKDVPPIEKIHRELLRDIMNAADILVENMQNGRKREESTHLLKDIPHLDVSIRTEDYLLQVNWEYHVGSARLLKNTRFGFMF